MTDTVIVASFRTRAEAELAALALDGAGIPYLIQSAEGMLHGPLGPGADIRVPRGAEEEARDLLADVADEPASGADQPPRRLVALGTWKEADLDGVLARLDDADVPYVIEHPHGDTAHCTVFVRREHQLPAGRALRRA